MLAAGALLRTSRSALTSSSIPLLSPQHAHGEDIREQVETSTLVRTPCAQLCTCAYEVTHLHMSSQPSKRACACTGMHSHLVCNICHTFSPRTSKVSSKCDCSERVFSCNRKANLSILPAGGSFCLDVHRSCRLQQQQKHTTPATVG